MMLKKSLLYHANVKFQNEVEYIGKPVEWKEIVDRLREAFHNPSKVFEWRETPRLAGVIQNSSPF